MRASIVICCMLLMLGHCEEGSPLLAQQQLSATTHLSSLSSEITTMFGEDQRLLTDVANARKDQVFNATYKSYVKRVEAETGNINFYEPAVFELWAKSADAPDVVLRYSTTRKRIDRRLQEIVAASGWPTRAFVGDEAAADFFFLFGHADDDNAWRATQVSTLEKVFSTDHFNPRLYAHLRDRIACVAGKPQIFGTIMGPGPNPGSAKLYWPLSDSTAEADRRRAAIGLPSIEQDLETYRNGAEIGPYMTPLTKDSNWSMADVYHFSLPIH